MNLRALPREQRLDAVGHVEAAIREVRGAIEVEPTCGPMLVAAYRALSALGELREVVDALPELERDAG